MVQITCQCGHTADFDSFTITKLGTELPPGQYQCPACGNAWKITREPGTYRYGGALYIPGAGKIEPVESEL